MKRKMASSARHFKNMNVNTLRSVCIASIMPVPLEFMGNLVK